MGDTTPPMNPTFHERGGGAARRVPTTQGPVSSTVGSSAVCTEPVRENSVTDAGRGMLERVDGAEALSGGMMNARVGASAATSSTGPALGSQLRDSAVATESGLPAGFTAAESTGGG